MLKINPYSWAGISGYSLAMGFMYQLGFWLDFHINIMQFISISDVLPSIAIIISIPIFCVVLYSLAFFKNIPRLEAAITNSPRFKISKEKILSRPVYLKILFIFLAILVCIFMFLAKSEIVVSVGLFVALIFTSTMLNFKTTLFSEAGKYRDVLFFTLAILPPLVFSVGHLKGQMILAGTNTFIVKSDSPCTNDKNTPYRYITTFSDKSFAISLKDNSICIFKYSYIRLIREKNTHLSLLNSQN